MGVHVFVEDKSRAHSLVLACVQALDDANQRARAVGPVRCVRATICEARSNTETPTVPKRPFARG